MKTPKTILIILLSTISLVILSGCIPLLLGTGTIVGGKMVAQDKTVGESISDTTIWTKIRASLMKNNVDGLLGSINVKVIEGRVLLTGSVNTQEDIIKVLKIVWDQDGVKDVINELKIIPTEERPGAITYTKDSWITTQVKTKLLLASNVKSSNYGVETIDGVVYLFGTAKNDEEAAEAKDIASSVSSVKQVVSYIRIRKNFKDSLSTHKQRHKGSLENDIDDDFQAPIKSVPPSSSPSNSAESKKRDNIFDDENIDYDNF